MKFNERVITINVTFQALTFPVFHKKHLQQMFTTAYQRSSPKVWKVKTTLLYNTSVATIPFTHHCTKSFFSSFTLPETFYFKFPLARKYCNLFALLPFQPEQLFPLSRMFRGWKERKLKFIWFLYYVICIIIRIVLCRFHSWNRKFAVTVGLML